MKQVFLFLPSLLSYFPSPPSFLSSIQYFRPYFVPHNVLGSQEMTLGKMDTDLPHPGAFSLSGKTAEGSD